MAPTDNVFDTFEKCGLQLDTHIKELLQKLGYKSLRAFAQEYPITPDKFDELEDNIRDYLANESNISKLNKLENSKAAKVALFGEVFCDNPSQFSFLPGEKASITSAVELCWNILKVDKTQLAIAAPTNKAPSEILGPTPASCKKPLLEVVRYWMLRNKSHLLTLEDVCVSEETKEIVCNHTDHLKAMAFRIVLDVTGYWKISNFTRHVKPKLAI
ncbi:hypothetical protein OUZ56_022040 [Daphnia magna]|uniref:Uncharacterized protein n=1 Tax=Daphnia magna TaxID=35525 RepID=A0ABR0AVB5_9CRUS|nr:hypothetical protein OUZ56_022040 [Daphnia magna]